MEVTGTPEAFGKACEAARGRGLAVGFVPTMGDLHDGHASLIRSARAECGFVALSIFVNPLQFESERDLADYPRRQAHDREAAAALGVDLVFEPDRSEMYPNSTPEITVDPGPLGGRLEGASRPGHFRGVLTVVAKLLNLAGPCRAYFGEKDAQQLALVRRMVADLDVPSAVVACRTIRHPDGLALSSRNARLTAEERDAAGVLFEALSDAAGLVRSGERTVDVLKAEMARRIGGELRARLDYVAIVDEQTWEEPRGLSGPARALVAAWLGETRLIDNIALPWPPGAGVHNSDRPEGGS